MSLNASSSGTDDSSTTSSSRKLVASSFMLLLVFCLSLAPHVNTLTLLDSTFSTIRPTDDVHLGTIAMIGDSTMKRAAQALSAFLNNCTIVRKGQRCDFPAYYGFSYTASLKTSEIPENFGPTANGKTNRGCQDCSGCEPVLWNCTIFGRALELEYIGIEFAADVEYQTDLYDTTQKNIILGYLQKRVETHTNWFVVFNTGIHDTTNIQGRVDVFEKQLASYADLLLSVFSRQKLLWLTSTLPRGILQPPEWRNITSNIAIHNLNQVSRSVMNVKGIEIADIGPLSSLQYFQNIYSDGVHVGPARAAWYSSVAYMILVEACRNIQC